jgi:fructokinase
MKSKRLKKLGLNETPLIPIHFLFHFFWNLCYNYYLSTKPVTLRTDIAWILHRFEEFAMIICCGEALIDMARAQIPGLGDGFLAHPGGSPYNTAIAIGKLGVPVKFLGKLSTDFFGEILVKKLRECHVEEDLLIRSSQSSTLAFVKLEKGKEPQYIFYTNGTADRSLQTDDLPQKLPQDTKCIIFGSISMTMEPIATAIETFILREGSRKSTDQKDGAPVISFDPNIRPFMIKDRAAYTAKFEKWIASSTIAKISVEDLAFIYPKLEPEKALKKVLAMGPWLAICTLGPKGALALLRRNDGSIIRVSAPVVDLPVADTIGAGDTFHGAFLSWLEIKEKMSRSALANLSETELYDALFFANKAASIVCTRRGMEPPSRREVVSLKESAQKSPGKPKPATKPKDTKKAAPNKKS